MLTLPNYQIGTQIYESANSIVYRGVQKKNNQPVILKVLKEDYPTPEELTRYRQEYEMTRQLNFDGVVKTYEIKKYQNTLVIILEDFGGESLKTALPLTPGKEAVPSGEELGKGQVPPPSGGGPGQFLSLAIQIAEVLGQIHAANIIHKDINPENIIWNQATNQLKIIDFGIASRLPRENPTLKNPNQLEGTLAYISPEQTGRMNRSLDYRTDLYSLGVTFYELLTGQLPFLAEEALELVHCHIAKLPATVHKLNPKISTILSEIVMKLMAKNADERYQSAFGLKHDLEKCLENLQSFKNLEGLQFELAQHDFSGRFQIPQKLYGREQEIKTLLQAFERVTGPSHVPSSIPGNEGGQGELMLVAGYSGVGKSALVHEVHKPMTEKMGYFAAGKFDQLERNIPYSAITQAFNAFCDYLLTESSEQLKQWREKILQAVGPNGQVLIDVIPHLELIIGSQSDVAPVGPSEAQNRFNLVFKNFFRAISQSEHPLILFIDDLQWADLASLNLLKNLLMDIENSHFLVIGAFRDNEVDKTHPFMLMVDEILEAQVIVNTISVANLTNQDVNQLVADTLGCGMDQAQALTELIYEKTYGNAFFTTEFLKSLYQEELLIFDTKERQWQWDVEKIAGLSITDNVVELMAGKIGLLPSSTIKVLKLAACIGNHFDLDMLAIIDQQDLSDTLASLWKAVEEGLVLPLDDHYKQPDKLPAGELQSHFKFQHDRVQQAAYSLIADADKQTIHLQIGSLLLNSTPQAELDEHLFDIVNQLNAGCELISDALEKQELTKLNLLAGQKAKTSAAHQTAFDYLQRGINLLETDSWETQYDLALALYEESVEAAYICTQFEETERLADIVLQQAKTVLDKVKVYESLMQAYTAQNQLLKVVETMLTVLKLLGIHFPEKPTDADIERGMGETMALLGDKPIEELIHLPEMTDLNHLATIRILSIAWNTTGITVPELVPLMTCEMINLSVKHGNAATSAYGYATATYLFSAMGEIETGYKFGQLALRVLEHFKAFELKAKVLNLVALASMPWKHLVKDILKPFLEAYQSSLETGDLEIAAQTASDYLLHAYLSGQELTHLRTEIVAYTKAIKQLKQENVVLYSLVMQQVVLNLTTQCDNPTELIGEAYNETTMFSQFQEDILGVCFFYLHKLILNYLFGKYAETLDNVAEAGSGTEILAGLFYLPPFYFYESLTQLALLSQESFDAEKKSCLDKVTAYQEQMQNWAHHAPMNFQHKYDLVEAEKARVLEHFLEAEKLYEKAIAGARENQFLQEEALAYELAAKFYLGRGLERIAQTYMREAHYAYQQWGAIAKVQDLEEKYPQFLSLKTAGTILTDMTISTTNKNSSQWLDLNSIMKAAETLSGEIVLSRLLEKMMHIVIENAGAEKGFLLLPQNDHWFIEAQGYVDSEEVKVLQSHPIENQPIADSMIHYVIRTQEPVVLHDASKEGQFTRDPYIVKQHPKSILCTPLINQGQITGILYLENHLTTGAFTPERLEVLKVLSSQLAITIENALLYRTLEQKVEERTAQLAQANEEITLLNEQLKSENLRMRAELDVSRQLQQMLLPKDEELKAIDGLDIAGFMEPADEVGGDYYDVLQHQGRILFTMGDVTGHGLESGALAIMVQSSIRTLLANNETDPVKFFSALNQMVCQNTQRMNVDKNLTLALVNYQSQQLYLSGQHEEMIIVRNGQLELIDTMELGFPVGLDENIAEFVHQIEVPLNPGDVIVLYTDGITEAENLDGQMYELERLCEIIQQNWQQTAQEIQQAVIADVRQFIGEQQIFDDITLLVLKKK